MKVKLPTLQVVDQTTSVQTDLACAVIDPTNGFAYFGTGTSGFTPPSILKVRLSGLQVVDSLLVAPEPVIGADIDAVNGFAYFAERGEG